MKMEKGRKRGERERERNESHTEREQLILARKCVFFQ